MEVFSMWVIYTYLSFPSIYVINMNGKMKCLYMGWAQDRFSRAHMVVTLDPFYLRMNICVLYVDTLLN